MKRIKLYGGILLCIMVVFIIYIIYIGGLQEERKELAVRVFTEKDTYMDGEWIPYSVIIENNTDQSVFYKVTACNVEIISTGENKFHVKTDLEAEFARLQLRLYELKAGEKVKRNMAGYNQYDLVHAMELKDYPFSLRPREYDPTVAALSCDWGTGLCLPAGEYIFTAEFLYYDSDTEEREPQKVTGEKKIYVTGAESDPIEETYVMNEKMIFYAKTDKSVYKEGEKIRTWAKVESIDGQWFRWYGSHPITVGISLIRTDTGKEIHMYNWIYFEFPEGIEYKDTFFLIPSTEDDRGRRIRKLYKEGNYIIQYVLWYYLPEAQEETRVTIELPITIVPDDSGMEFYESPPYPFQMFEAYYET